MQHKAIKRGKPEIAFSIFNYIFFTPRFFISKYPGIIPPENSMVKSTRSSMVLEKGRYFLDRGYAVVAVNSVPNKVPDKVTSIVVK